MNRETIFKETKRTGIVIVSAIIYSLGLICFLIPAGVYSGGMTGFCQLVVDLLNRLISINLSGHLGLLIFISNIPFLILAWVGISKKFAIYTLVSVVLQSVFLDLIPHFQFLDDPLTNTLTGGLLTGVGIGLALKYGTSTGSFDILGQYYALKKGMSVGFLTLMVNLIIAFVGGWIFGWERCIYTIIRLLINTIVIDQIHTAYNQAKVEIICNNPDLIADELLKVIKRGATEFPAIGAYSHENKIVISMIISSFEYSLVQETVHKYDEKAFIVVTPVKKIIGNFKRHTIS